MTTALTTAPELTTDRLTLRGPWADDLSLLTKWTTTSTRMAIMGGNGTVSEARFAFLINIGRWQMDGMGFFTVTRRDDPVALGRVGLLYYPQSDVRPKSEVELAWHLFDGAEGHGFASEAGRAVLGWARAILKLDRIVSFILPANTRSQATARRLGATTDGSRAAHDADAEVWFHKVAA